MVSTSAEAKTLGVSRKFLRDHQILTANAAWHLERASWRSIVDALGEAVGPRVKCLAFVDYQSYDGVDLKLLTKSFWRKVQELAPAADLSDAGTVTKLLADLKLRKPVEVQYGIQKILHCRSKVGLLLEIDGRLVHLVGSLASLLVGMDRSTGETIVAAILRHAVATTGGAAFPRFTRVNESDGATYNDRAERKIARKMNCKSLKFTCEVHVDAGTHKKVYSICARDVSGMINMTLSLRDFGMLVPWRQAARRVLRRLLKVYDHLELDDGAIQYPELI